MSNYGRRPRSSLDRVDTAVHQTRPVSETWEAFTKNVLQQQFRSEVGQVWRNDIGSSFEVVPLSSHEQTSSAVPWREPLDSRLRGALGLSPLEVYRGHWGDILFQQPKAHRKQWSALQWSSYREYLGELEAERNDDSDAKASGFASMVVKNRQPKRKPKPPPRSKTQVTPARDTAAWHVRGDRGWTGSNSNERASGGRVDSEISTLLYDDTKPALKVEQPDPPPLVVLAVMCKKWHTIDLAYMTEEPQFVAHKVGLEKESLWLVRSGWETSVLVCPICGEWSIWHGRVSELCHDRACVRKFL